MIFPSPIPRPRKVNRAQQVTIGFHLPGLFKTLHQKDKWGGGAAPYLAYPVRLAPRDCSWKIAGPGWDPSETEDKKKKRGKK